MLQALGMHDRRGADMRHALMMAIKSFPDRRCCKYGACETGYRDGGCLLVRQSFFHNNPQNFADIGGGVQGCRGFHSSFRPAQGGLSLNIDVSTTMIVKPGSVVNFLIENQSVRDPFSIDWAKAKRTLKSLRIKAVPSNQEFKIIGLSDLPCNKQLFTLKQRGDKEGEMLSVEITVFDYFVKHRNIGLRFSADLPCINVGKPKRPTYLPIEEDTCLL